MSWLPLPPVRVILGWAIVIFLIWWVIKNPDHAAADVRGIGHAISVVAQALSVFVSKL
jgi:hypothetical protein